MPMRTQSYPTFLHVYSHANRTCSAVYGGNDCHGGLLKVRKHVYSYQGCTAAAFVLESAVLGWALNEFGISYPVVAHP